jgi:hypothetical protein
MGTRETGFSPNIYHRVGVFPQDIKSLPASVHKRLTTALRSSRQIVNTNVTSVVVNTGRPETE